jgi:RNA 2',3'-cyclic 3'-phosphodiesterase
VAKERLKSPRARLFTALDLPDDVRAGLAAWQAEACADEALRAVARDALHVTLCFLGYLPERAIAEVGELVEGLEARPVELRFEPEPVGIKGRRPGLYAIDAPSENAIVLQAELSERLAENRLYKPEKRPFWPHVTVARVRPERAGEGSSGRRRRGKPRIVERPPGALPQALLQPFGAVRVALYRSHLRSSGARYERLAALQLPPATSGRER